MDWTPPTMPPVVETSLKSALLLPVLAGGPAVSRRTQAYWSAGVPESAGSGVPVEKRPRRRRIRRREPLWRAVGARLQAADRGRPPAGQRERRPTVSSCRRR